ncbi:hypothetical protein [Candidatus Mycoplasma haematominutum]|uniref:Uncharacterized protein n=1 Tax=Candidatus Mycoplasma haematominutum 'Birmingham 1' TaxID=1116213 RepID=G8C3U7_9MOLU|nr:hypothetical protein [Candidatus Mycoplasma haematominutum]CCE66995.1 hypothetical protein MHM_04770 [Candidatus Mycoplasma haematominutum 'Birmingham 1']
MISLLKLCLALVALASVSSAVAIPATLHVQGNMEKTSTGGGQPTSQLQLTKCTSGGTNQGNSVDFGTSTAQNVCWSADSSSQIGATYDSDYSSLLSSNWGKQPKDWNENSAWKKVCTSGTNNWELWISSESETETPKDIYLGKCGAQGWENTSFLKVSQDSSKTKVSVCEKECWESPQTSSTVSQTKIQLQQEKVSKFTELKFYSGNVQQSA